MVKISGVSAFFRGKSEETEETSPPQPATEVTNIVPSHADSEPKPDTDPVEDRRNILKNLQESENNLRTDYESKCEIANKADKIAEELRERLSGLSSLTEEIDAFYQQEIESRITNNENTLLPELPESLTVRKRELDSIERQVIVAENCSQRRREEATAVWKDIEGLKQEEEDALHSLMACIAEIRAANINQRWWQYVTEVVSLWALIRRQFTQYDMYNSYNAEKPIYVRKDLTVSNNTLAASMGYQLDRQRLAAQYGGNVDANGRKWGEAINRLREDAYADCSDLCPELPGISVSG
ncbi:MAG: hypothetical protein ABF876_03100 [Acetobacter aceti]|uniref:hypothetical protein n=1 Tax=Gluconobacter sp. TaxID=1876758 RepID=UPI0039ECC749